MTINFDSLDDDEDRFKTGLIRQALLDSQEPVTLEQLHPDESSRIERVKAIGAAIPFIGSIRSNSALQLAKITPIPSSVSAVKTAAKIAGIGQTSANDTVFDLAATPSPKEQFEADVKSLTFGLPDEKTEKAIESLEEAKRALEDLSAVPQTDKQIHQALNRTAQEDIISVGDFPNLAFEVLKLGIRMEEFHTEEKLKRYKQEGAQCKATIDTLIKLSAQLPKMNSDDSSYELKQETKLEIRRLSEILKKSGVDLFPGLTVESNLSKEELAAASSLINHHIDANRTKLQELFTTKISVSIQFLQMMMDVMKKVIDYDDRHKRKALELLR